MAAIKITANTSELRRSIMDVAGFAKKGFGKSSVSLFDKDTVKLLSGEADKVLSRLETRSKTLKNVISEYGKKVKEAAGDSRKESEYREKLLRTTQRLIAVEKARSDISTSARTMRGGSMGQMASGLGSAAKDIPGVGGLLGIGTMGGLGLAAGAAVVGAGMYGYSRMSAGYDRYKSGIGSRIKLMGRGVRDTDMNANMREPFAQTGMDEEAVRQARLQSMDSFGTAGSTQQAVLGRAQFSRNYGIGTDQLQGLGAGMRAQTSSSGANRDIMKLQASLQASGIRDAIGPYLETAASMLTDIRKDGLTNSGEVLGMLATLTKATGNSPERIAHQITGFQSAVQGSTGDSNAFFQTAFARAGIGGKTIGGTQAAIRSGGIFGVNAADYKGLSKDSLNALGALHITGPGTGAKERIGSIMDLADKMFQGKSPESKLAKARFMMPKMGASNEVESMEMMDQFKKARGDTTGNLMEKFEARLKNNNASPEQKSLTNLEQISKSQEGALDKLEAIRSDQLEFMGKQAAPSVMLMSKSLLHIDEIISSIYGGLASVIPGMKTDSQKMDGAMNGNSAMTSSQAEEVVGRGQGNYLKSSGSLIASEYDVKNEISNRTKEDSKNGMNPKFDEYLKGLQVQLKNIAEAQKLLVHVNQEHVAVSKSIDTSTKKTAKSPKGVTATTAAKPEESSK